ncbi:cytochrome c biogenesis CcdA family protein [Arenivirga flava]|uniref:Cytochrome C biogenesis protein CcdA n=1 Tax=Arenivirga flava TaxID=1930060 RepID=A0AA37XBW3_9MICO|nr:cytochrome c biogenesis protein CcdA [Arenivirga flava]GMA29206.1 cytochrome C biogenesis protein CcdA [Arenivirga flava]
MGGNPFAETMLQGSLLVGVPIALLAGLAAFLSPCVLPLVPGYLGFVGGLSSGRKDRRRLLLGVALFVLGFSVVFVAMNTASGAVGFWLGRWEEVITRVMGVIVILMGFVFLGFFGLLQRTVKPNLSPRAGLIGAPLLGFVFGIGWAPCMGPVLATIVLISLDGGSPAAGALLGLAYSLGLGIPFLLVALGFGWVSSSVAFVKRHIRIVNIIGGALLVVIGLLMVSGVWSAIMRSLQGVMASYGTIL